MLETGDSLMLNQYIKLGKNTYLASDEPLIHTKYLDMLGHLANEEMERQILRPLRIAPVGKLHPPQDFTITENENGEIVVNMKSPETTYRGYVLSHAKRLTEGDRNEAHGDPYPMMKAFADMVSVYLTATLGQSISLEPHDAAMLLQLYKICRIAHNPNHEDSHFDNCAYGAIVAECVHIEECTSPVADEYGDVDDGE